jgi:hypothetical protein
MVPRESPCATEELREICVECPRKICYIGPLCSDDVTKILCRLHRTGTACVYHSLHRPSNNNLCYCDCPIPILVILLSSLYHDSISVLVVTHG